MNPAPIVLFVYNRPIHTLRTLRALQANKGAEESSLFIFADGPKSDSSPGNLANIRAVREIIRQEQWCKTVTIEESVQNKGLGASVIAGVTQIVNASGKVIVLEDDLVSSAYFLQFMNEALECYEHSESVGCISGYNYPLKGKVPETYFIKNGECWGWATWKRSWTLFNADGKSLLSALEDRNLIADFNFQNSYPYSAMLKGAIEGKNNSWAILWYASLFLENKYCLYPGHSLIQNEGNDGSGIHCETNQLYEVILATAPVLVKHIPIEEHKQMKKKIASFFKTLPPGSMTKRLLLQITPGFLVSFLKKYRF